jgi:hypothetical protein
LLNQITVSELRKALPHLGSASCGDNEELHIAADGIFKHSRLKREYLLTLEPEIHNFFW